ncbi:hypothetical protein OPV22_035127 [Ensete ventricosum]|uniref:Uncharacterized protein n=1 Tax=Ensete ventricosum TaxID=4639 RepID=A0AAX5NFZ8_ENSVE|nr:hypothetical protein OPV22_035127 [Ensete ventricosum]RWW16951.1 hypothetical protein GW17_00019138 [Ensete ventricosum]RWW80706.1 hypothetical protein BHE74_00010938 [Ensete ventricosum]RZR85407.1 hypothetical protein BHM03_00012382 [Ensete ventricosum]
MGHLSTWACFSCVGSERKADLGLSEVASIVQLGPAIDRERVLLGFQGKCNLRLRLLLPSSVAKTYQQLRDRQRLYCSCAQSESREQLI